MAIGILCDKCHNSFKNEIDEIADEETISGIEMEEHDTVSKDEELLGKPWLDPDSLSEEDIDR